MEMYEVGGCVRDEILGVKSKDIDFACVLSPDEIPAKHLSVWPFSPFEVMEQRLREMGFDLIDKARKPEHFTARGFFPKKFVRMNTSDEALAKFAFAHPEMAADFVLARKEGTYSDGRRPDSVEVGTLEDDLARRDFTMNAIARDMAGNFIDPYNGRQDIAEGVIRCVGTAFDRLSEDALRAVRALRFSVTKGFRIDREVEWAMETYAVLDSIVNKISDERIAKELETMFRFDTVASLHALAKFPLLTDAIFAGSVSLDATMKTKGRGKTGGRPKRAPNLPTAHHDCTCRCHKEKGVMHIAACC